MLEKIQSQKSTTEEVLNEYAFLKDHADYIAKRLDSLKSILVEVGTCSSENYICLVDKRQRTVGPNKKTLESLLGADVLAAHSSKITYTTVSVKRKH